MYIRNPSDFDGLSLLMLGRMSQKQVQEGQVYSVPLIQPDLRREEAVHQIADALFYLENISTDIFRR